MRKIHWAAIAATILVPTAAFAAHVATCCGDFWCCLQHLGCCP